MRIVSLLPSATEILFDLGAGDDVVGVTVECDYPPQARTRRIVSTSALPDDLSAADIDAAVARALADGEDHTSIGVLGAAAHRGEAAAGLTSRLTTRLSSVQESVAGRPS